MSEGRKTYDPTTWKPGRLDLILSVVITLSLPPLAGWLYDKKGALIPMLIYYGLAWGLVKLRRGVIGYRTPMPEKPPVWFYINVAVIIIALAFAYMSPIKVENPWLPGVVLTALLWAPANASSEQILWLYIFDSWDLYPRERRIGYRIVGLLLFAAFVGMIHAMFWTKFLQVARPDTVFGALFVLATAISGFLHIPVWRRSGQMVFTFLPHFLLNLGPLLWTGYSILPYLWK
ncbi:hypothetical protein [Thermococcus pacificus]|uniref:CAAX protease n=1 Tax=Thermococcus pacificus TaxID=71998 RepID=A0A218P958_9EURY|nr:hypothetical protein [Thermococcus pacificus]ASJ07327.1 hypothetical protein A3L08_08335 [Thermococcus pacificus]